MGLYNKLWHEYLFPNRNVSQVGENEAQSDQKLLKVLNVVNEGATQ